MDRLGEAFSFFVCASSFVWRSLARASYLSRVTTPSSGFVKTESSDVGDYLVESMTE